MSQNILINKFKTKHGSIVEAFYNKSDVACIRHIDECGEVIEIRRYKSTRECLKAFRKAYETLNTLEN